VLDRTGSLEVGKDADVIALDGDPLRSIDALRQVVFVMQQGQVGKQPESARRASAVAVGVA
jgi:imidazolonepropionase-like amidohydrolase